MQKYAQAESTMAGVGLLIYASIGLWLKHFSSADFAQLAGPATFLILWPQRHAGPTTLNAESANITTVVVPPGGAGGEHR